MLLILQKRTWRFTDGLFADLFNKCILHAHSVPGTVIGAGDIMVKRQTQTLPSWSPLYNGGDKH